MATTKTQLVEMAKMSKVGRVWEHPSADEVRIYVGPHFISITEASVILDGVEHDAIKIEAGKGVPQRGGKCAAIRAAAKSMGLEIR